MEDFRLMANPQRSIIEEIIKNKKKFDFVLPFE